MMKYLITVLVFCAACSTQADSQEIKVIDAEVLVSKQSAGVVVIDVRTPEEYSDGRIPGAKNIPLGDGFVESMEKLDKTDAIILYCHSGGRSTKAANQLKAAGFKTIYNYTGSYSDWSASKRDIEMD